MSHRLTADEVIHLLHLEPLPGEGGFFRQTVLIPGPEPEHPHQPAHTAILYLITPRSWSGLHRLDADELFHFYMGDPCEMAVCSAVGGLELRRLGTDLKAGCQVQSLVPAGAWQGTRLVEPAAHGYALLGTTMTPGFRQDQFQLATRRDLDTLPKSVAARLERFMAPDASPASTDVIP